MQQESFIIIIISFCIMKDIEQIFRVTVIDIDLPDINLFLIRTNLFNLLLFLHF